MVDQFLIHSTILSSLKQLGGKRKEQTDARETPTASPAPLRHSDPLVPRHDTLFVYPFCPFRYELLVPAG